MEKAAPGVLKYFQSDLFLKRYAIYFSGSMIVAVLNYLFHPVLGRLLAPSDFGDVQALISLIAQAGVIFTAFSIVVVNITANLEDRVERDAIIGELQKIALYVVAVAVLAVLLFLSPLGEFLNFSTPYLLLGLVVMLPLTSLVTFRNAYLQGSGRFWELSVGGIISSGGRLVLAAGLILLGMNVFGVIAGLVMAQAALLIYLFFTTRQTLHLNVRTNIHILEK
ncbi:MAG: oligosaccharide flippase family protein, partial [Parcubacteria group bacterium]